MGNQAFFYIIENNKLFYPHVKSQNYKDNAHQKLGKSFFIFSKQEVAFSASEKSAKQVAPLPDSRAKKGQKDSRIFKISEISEIL